MTAAGLPLVWLPGLDAVRVGWFPALSLFVPDDGLNAIPNDPPACGPRGWVAIGAYDDAGMGEIAAYAEEWGIEASGPPHKASLCSPVSRWWSVPLRFVAAGEIVALVRVVGYRTAEENQHSARGRGPWWFLDSGDKTPIPAGVSLPPELRYSRPALSSIGDAGTLARLRAEWRQKHHGDS